MNRHIQYLASQAVAGKLSRRDFLGKAAALGLTAVSANLVLANSARAAGPQKGGTLYC